MDSVPPIQDGIKITRVVNELCAALMRPLRAASILFYAHRLVAFCRAPVRQGSCFFVPKSSIRRLYASKAPRSIIQSRPNFLALTQPSPINRRIWVAAYPANSAAFVVVIHSAGSGLKASAVCLQKWSVASLDDYPIFLAELERDDTGTIRSTELAELSPAHRRF